MFVKRLGLFFLDILEVVVFAVAIFLFVYLLLMQPHKIKGASMEPNFPDGEYLLTDKITYRFKEPTRGDVVVFKAPGANGEEFIKRIIGLPNETIKIENGKVFINEKLLVEEYLASSLTTQAGVFIQKQGKIIVPTDHFFVLGDNRPSSSDSRTWGFISKSDITGRAWFIYWPISSLGTVEAVSYNFQESF